MDHDHATVIRAAIEGDPRSLYAIAKAAGLRYCQVYRFLKTPGAEIRTDAASKLCDALGLRLTAGRRKRK